MYFWMRLFSLSANGGDSELHGFFFVFVDCSVYVIGRVVAHLQSGSNQDRTILRDVFDEGFAVDDHIYAVFLLQIRFCNDSTTFV